MSADSLTLIDLAASAGIIAAAIGLLIAIRPRDRSRADPPISARSMRWLDERMEAERHQHPGRDS